MIKSISRKLKGALKTIFKLFLYILRNNFINDPYNKKE